GQVLHGSWQGPGSSCTPNPCPPPSQDSGACCFTDGSCSYISSAECMIRCGKFIGLGVPCSPGVCPLPDSISGMVLYDNTVNSPLSNVQVLLSDLDAAHCLDSVLTGTTGSYLFKVWPGDYLASATTTRPWVFGAANSVDALRTLRHFVHLDTLEGLKLVAADVNASHSVNTTDAYLIAGRFVGQVGSFAAGDWVFTTDSLSLAGKATVTSRIYGLLVGDVDASHIPTKALSPSLGWLNDGTTSCEEYPEVMLPIYADRMLSLGSLSLELGYAFTQVRVLDVQCSAPGGMVLWKDHEGMLRVSWYSLDEWKVEPGKALLWIRLRWQDTRSLNPRLAMFYPGAACQASDVRGNPVRFVLVQPWVLPPVKEVVLGPNRPNPFSGETEISYYLPCEGEVLLEVRDALGRRVMTLAEGDKDAGEQRVSFSCRDCLPGIYIYTLKAAVNGDLRVLSRRMVLTR
ncbi:MAG TPA: hypothetical protein P5550_05970, partial [Bacteroidales bacterium]|nr:hypothetical protein [Bacteroidales bacterium]